MKLDAYKEVLKGKGGAILVSLILVFWGISSFGQSIVLDNTMHHLRKGRKEEWSGFEVPSQGNKMVIHFRSSANKTPRTLSLEQYDVNQSWKVMLNDQKIGDLTPDEKRLTAYFSVPPDAILEGDNSLVIESADTSAEPVDDIGVGKIVLQIAALNDLLSQATFHAEVTDADRGRLIPARLTIAARTGALQPVVVSPEGDLAVRTGCVYTGSGKATLALAAGTYVIYATRGFEYGVDSIELTLKPGDHVSRKFMIKREVPTEGWVSSDTHIHSLTYSGHGDATIKERVLSIAGEGIELPVITEHNANVDIDALAKGMNLRNYFTPVAGNEVTTPVGHFNVFPVSPDDSIIDYRVNNWNLVSEKIAKAKTVKAIILNHPRDEHNGFRPFDSSRHVAAAGMTRSDWTFPANAMEVVNSGAQQQDLMRLYKDWFGMLNRGYRLTPVGASDAHDVIRYMVGQGRTYIRAKDMEPGNIDMGEAINNFIKGKVMVCFGLQVEINVDSVYGPGDLVDASDHITVNVRVLGPSWTMANRVSLYSNGKKIKEATISRGGAPGIKYDTTWILQKPGNDVFLAAVAEGPDPARPFWQIAKPFQHDTPEWTPHVIGSSGAVWIEADDDGHFTSAFEYATKSVQDSRNDLPALMKSLERYDEAVSVQAAAILYQNGIDMTGPAVTAALLHASAETKEGFERFISEINRMK